MRIKKYLAVLLASACVFSMQVPAYAEDGGEAEVQAVEADTGTAEGTGEETQEAAPEGEVQEAVPEDAAENAEAVPEETTEAQSPQITKTVKKLIKKRCVMVIQAFKFADGSIDVWQSGSGLAVSGNEVVAPAALTSFASADDEAYLNLAKAKRDLYARVGVDLNDFDTVQESMVTYVVPADGTYTKCSCEYTDQTAGLSLLTADGDLGAEKPSYRKDYMDTMTLAGFTSDSLSTAASTLAEGGTSCERGKTSLTAAGSGEIQDGTLTASEMLDLGYTGGTLFDEDGSVCGMVVSVSETEATVVSGAQLQNFVSVGPGEEEDNAACTEALDKLELAVDRAKNIDTSGFTDESTEIFEQAIKNAEEVLGDADAELDEITKAGEALNTAKDGLEEPAAEESTGFDRKKLVTYGGIAAIAAVLAALFFFLRKTGKKNGKQDNTEAEDGDARKKSEKHRAVKAKRKDRKLKEKKKERETSAEKEGGYGGEYARKSAVRSGEDGEEGTSVLSQEGNDETTVLKSTSLPKAYLATEDGGRIDIDKKEFVIGKERKKVSYCITGNTTVSRRHCMIRLDGEDITLEDLGSLNGTSVNGASLSAHVPVKLTDGDTLTVSDVILIFHTEG